MRTMTTMTRPRLFGLIPALCLSVCACQDRSPEASDGGEHDAEDMAVVLPCDPRPVSADAIHVVHHDGQTFVTWPDEGSPADGPIYRYDVYRSDVPITDATLSSAERWQKGGLYNSAALFGTAFYPEDRLDPATPTTVIEEGGTPLPPWSGLAVHTATADACAYYAVIVTDAQGTPIRGVVPGVNATTVAVAERVAPRRPIKLYDSTMRDGPSIEATKITGTPNLPLEVILHASNAQGGGAGAYGDYFLYYADTTMGYVDGMPGVYSVEETHSGPQHLMMRNRDLIVRPSGTQGLETYWFGYACVPDWAPDASPMAYPFTERRLAWMIENVITRYAVDREHVSCTGGSMGAWGTVSFGLRHPELFSSIYPDRPRFRHNISPSLVAGLDFATLLMEDGVTLFRDRMDAVKYVDETDELPFVGWGIGRRDGYATWQEQLDFVAKMTETHHAFAFSWNDGDHSTGTQAITLVKTDYPPSRFALHQSYPAFGHSSLDDDLGDGDPANGDLVGGINLGFDWTVTTDDTNDWVVTLSNHRATGPMTVDVTPRRAQKFVVTPGATVQFSSSTGQSGTVVADAAGLVTVPGVAIEMGTPTILSLHR